MASRRQKWAKVPRSILADENQLELGAAARWVRLLCLTSGLEDEGHLVAGEPANESIGWLITEAGRPYTAKTLARMSGHDVAVVENAIADLKDLGLLVADDEGVLGYVGWRETQESPSAERKRRQREREAAERDSHAAVTGSSRSVTTEEEEEEEDRGRTKLDARPRGQSTRAPQALPAGEAQPDLTWLDGPEPEPPTDAAQQVFDAWIKHREELGLTTKRIRLTTKRRKAIIGRGSAEVLLGLARAREKLTREAERAGLKPSEVRGAEFFRLSTLTKEENLERLAEHHPSLDERRPQARDGPRYPAKRRAAVSAPFNLNEDEGGEI